MIVKAEAEAGPVAVRIAPHRPEAAFDAYRIMQEAGTSAVKHAAAGEVDMHLDRLPATLTVTAAAGGGPGGGGLVGVRERARGGTARTGPDSGSR